MDIIYVLEAYQKMEIGSRMVFIDTLEQISSYIRNAPPPNGKVTGGLVEGVNIVIFVYKKNIGFGLEVTKYYNLSDSAVLGYLAFQRMHNIDILEKGKIVQRLTMSKETELEMDKLLMKDKVEAGLCIIDPTTGKYIFNDAIIQKEGDLITMDGKEFNLSECSDDLRGYIDAYFKMSQSFGKDELSRQLNLDDSYFNYSLLLTDRGNIEKIKNICLSDESKDILRNIEFKDGKLLLNNKIFVFESTRQNDGKAIEFIELLSNYFSTHHATSLSIQNLMTFIQTRNEGKFKHLDIKSMADPAKIKNGYLSTFDKKIDKIFGGKPRIFTVLKGVIYLQEMKKDENSSQDEDSK